MSEHFAPTGAHPVELIEPDVSAMFKRTMTKAERDNRFLEPGEEFNLTHMSVAVSLRRIADSLDTVGWWLIVLALSAPALLVACLATLGYIATKL